MRYYTDFGSFNYLKDSERPNKFMIQTFARSSSEKTQVDQKQLMIQTLPRCFPCGLLGTYSRFHRVKELSNFILLIVIQMLIVNLLNC